jgi:epoxyqueuosine reductase
MNLFDEKKLKDWGVVDYGYTIDAIPESLDHYNNWIDKFDHLPLTYLEGERQKKRQSLTEYWPEFQSALIFLFSYHDTHQKIMNLYRDDPLWNGLKIASYTLGFKGLDYHHIIKQRLVEIGESLKENNNTIDYKLVLDTHPVLERDLALRAKMGWFGKNSMLINRNHGSFFIIGSILLNQELSIDSTFSNKESETDHCGQCTKCIEACPTQAIDPVTRTIKAQECISTFTIEQFKLDTIPSDKMTLKNGFIFGCDICQDVCPWNMRVDRLKEKLGFDFKNENQNKLIDFFLKTDVKDLGNKIDLMSNSVFNSFFKNTSFERSGKRGMLKNIIFYLKESGHTFVRKLKN